VSDICGKDMNLKTLKIALKSDTPVEENAAKFI